MSVRVPLLVTSRSVCFFSLASFSATRSTYTINVWEFIDCMIEIILLSVIHALESALFSR